MKKKKMWKMKEEESIINVYLCSNVKVVILMKENENSININIIINNVCNV